MDDQRKLRIAALFEAAMDLPRDEQVRYLERECGDDHELMRAVQKLLDADVAGAGRVASPPVKPRARERDIFLAREYAEDGALRRAVQELIHSDVAETHNIAPGRVLPDARELDHVPAREPTGGAAHAASDLAWGGTALPTTGATRDIDYSAPAARDDSAARMTLDTPPRQCAIAIGSQIGRYRIVQKLGAGGMGVVFLARHEELVGHEAVVKVLLHRAMASSADSVQRFEREAKLAAQIHHPGVVRVMDFGRHESGDLFILMERLYGESLQHRLEREERLPPATAVSFALHVARALEAVHAHGVHRDLKPHNLFLVPDIEVPGAERVKILDFGIAKTYSDTSELTRSYVTMGTAAYMAPEQCLDAARVDARADLYSLGVILFQMLCGELPFPCKSLGEYIVAHTQKQPPLLGERVPVSRALSDLVARLLAKHPEERLPSARALGLALEALPERHGASPPESAITTPRVMHEQAVHAEMSPLAMHVVTLPTVPGSRFRHGRAESASAPPLYTEPQAPAPAAAEPTHLPACLAPSDTAPAITVAPGIVADTSSEHDQAPGATSGTAPGIRGAPGATSGTAPGIRGAPGATIDTLSMATIASAERPGGAAGARDPARPGALGRMYRHAPLAGAAILVVTLSAAALRLASRPASGADDARADAGLPADAALVAGEDAPDLASAIELRGRLGDLFDGASEAVQRELIRAAVDVGTPEVAWLLDRAVAEGRPATRSEAGRAMCELGWPDRARKLRDAMRDSAGVLRVQLAAALVCLGDREGIGVLERELTAEGLLRIEAAGALAMAGERALVQPMLERELDGAVPGSPPWLHAARGLLALGHAEARSRLERELARPEPGRALAAADILAGAGDGAARAYLDRVVADAEFTQRAEAALILAHHARGDELAGTAGRLLGFAEVALASPDAHDRRAAVAVVGRLAEHGGERFAPALARMIASDDAHDAAERAVRITARVALLAVHRAMESRNANEHQ